MATKTIRQLTELTGLVDSGDFLAISDISDSDTKKLSIGNLFDSFSFDQSFTYTVGTGGDFANITEVQAFLDKRRLSRGSDAATTRNGNLKITLEFLAGTHEMPTNGYWNIENLGYYLIIKGQGSATTSIIRNPLKTGTHQLTINNSHVIIDAITLNLQDNNAIYCGWGAQLYLGAQASDVAFVGGMYLDHGSVLQTYQAIDFGLYDITVDNGSYARFAGVTCDDFWVYDSKVYCDGPITVADDFYVRRSSVYVNDNLILNGTSSVLGVERQSSLTVTSQVRATNNCTLQVRDNSQFLLGDMNSVDFVNNIEVLHNSSVFSNGSIYSKADCMVGESSKLHAEFDLEVGQSFQCYRGSSVYVNNQMIITNPNLPILIVDDSKVFVGSSFTSSSTTQELSIYNKGYLHVATDATILGNIDLDDHSVLFVDNTLTIGSAVTPTSIFVDINSSKLECQDLVYTTASTAVGGVLIATDNATINAEATVTFNTTATTSTVRDLILVERNSLLASYNNFTWNNTGNATNVNLFKVRRNGTVVIEDNLITTSDQVSNRLFNLFNPSNVNVSGITSTMTENVQGILQNELLSGITYNVGDSADTDNPHYIKKFTTGTPATNGQVLSWDSDADAITWSTIGGLDSAGVVTVLNNASVGEFVNTDITTSVTVMGDGVANIDNRPDAIPSSTTAFGASALNALGSGADNTAVGRLAAANITTGVRNNAFGSGAMSNSTTSTSDAVAIGTLSLSSSSGNQNTAVGNSSGSFTGTSKNSVFIGYQAGYNQAATGTDGTNNIVIGHTASRSSNSVNNEITLGNASIDRLRIPGLGLDTIDATDKQFLTWDSATGNFAWLSVTDLDFSGLPVIDPAVVGKLWIDSDAGGVLKVSRG